MATTVATACRCGRFTPQVGAGGTVAYEAPVLEHVGDVPRPDADQGLPFGAGAPLCLDCAPGFGAPVVARELGLCVNCRCGTSYRFTPQVGADGTVAYEAPTLEHVGDVPQRRAPGLPFGVDFSEAEGRHTVQVRDAHGDVAYVSVGLATQDAARWAALSWLRGYAREVRAEDAAALRESFKAESLKIDPPAGAPPPEVVTVKDDPLAELMAANIPEPLRDRLLAWLRAREGRWDAISDDAADVYVAAVCKGEADADLAEVIAALGGAS